MRRSALTCVLAWGVLVGCGDSRPDVDVNEDNLCAEQAKVLCYNTFRCCDAPWIGQIERQIGVDPPLTPLSCRVGLTAACEDWVAPLLESLEEGRIELDADALNGCLEAMIAPDGVCNGVGPARPWSEACGVPAFIGTVPTGADCDHDYECAAAASYCMRGDVCAPLPGDGEPCAEAAQAWESDRCGPGFHCTMDICVARPGEGEPCANGAVCAEGLYCDPELRTCAQRSELGEACATYNQCAAGSCPRGTCDDDGSGCYRDEDCGGYCADDRRRCVYEWDCTREWGACSVSGTECRDLEDCAIGEVCVQPVACEWAACAIDSVCELEGELPYFYCEYTWYDKPFEAPDP